MSGTGSDMVAKGSFKKLDRRGFTLVELVIIIVVLGILAAVAIPKFSDMTSGSKEIATQKEMLEIKRAIIGNPEIIAGGRPVYPGFEGDVGHPPNQLLDLVRRPDSVPPYDRLSRLGWNGPYVDSSAGRYLIDAWGTPYIYDPLSRRLLSVGGPDTIRESF